MAIIILESEREMNGREGFDDVDFLRDRGILDKKSWWLVDNW